LKILKFNHIQNYSYYQVLDELLDKLKKKLKENGKYRKIQL